MAGIKPQPHGQQLSAFCLSHRCISGRETIEINAEIRKVSLLNFVRFSETTFLHLSLLPPSLYLSLSHFYPSARLLSFYVLSPLFSLSSSTPCVQVYANFALTFFLSPWFTYSISLSLTYSLFSSLFHSLTLSLSFTNSLKFFAFQYWMLFWTGTLKKFFLCTIAKRQDFFSGRIKVLSIGNPISISLWFVSF